MAFNQIASAAKIIRSSHLIQKRVLPRAYITNNSSYIPVIDFGRFRHGDGSARKEVSDEIFQAFKNVGFVYIKNHGIPQELINRMFDQSKQFFALPMEEKLPLEWECAESNRGYVPHGREKLTDLDKTGRVEEIKKLREQFPDCKESFEIGKEPSLTYQNRWPSSLPTLRPTAMEFYGSAHNLYASVMKTLAVSLKLDDEYFDKLVDKQDNNLRLLHYPGIHESQLSKGANRAGAHCDYGALTFVFQDQTGGLEVKRTDGQFVRATPIEGTIVINVGDMLSRWSNDILKSTEHRVVSPNVKDEKGFHPDRYSIAYFCNPNFDAEIDCIPGCFDEKRPKKYKPVKSLDYLVSRLSATY